MRWGIHTHTLGESGHWVCGSCSQLQWKDLCVAVVAILGPFSSGAFVSHPRRAISQRHKESGKGGKVRVDSFFSPFLLNASFFFDFKGYLPVLECPLWFTFRQFSKKAGLFLTCTLCCVDQDEEIKRGCRLRCNSHLLFRHDLTEVRDTVGLFCDTVYWNVWKISSSF